MNSCLILEASLSSDLSSVLFVSGMFDKVYRDVESVRSRAIAKIESLRVTTEEQVGLEIFQLFIIDLLGRNSPAAKIFESKLGEDFEETVVVRRYCAGHISWRPDVFGKIRAEKRTLIDQNSHAVNWKICLMECQFPWLFVS